MALPRPDRAQPERKPPAPPLPDLIDVAGGIFSMGSAQQRKDEAPVHRVAVRDFRMARLPVTNQEFALYLADSEAASPRFWSDPRFSAAKQPVVGVAWDEAVAFCDWLSRRSGLAFRLPTEAEWEYAALSGRSSALYPWGDGMPAAVSGEPLDLAPMDRPAPAGTGPANLWGIQDMGWNVHEWCSDWYDPGYYATSPAFDPRGPERGDRKCSRGGAWRHQIKVSRCAARSAIPPQFQYNDYGFRVVARPG